MKRAVSIFAILFFLCLIIAILSMAVTLSTDSTTWELAWAMSVTAGVLFFAAGYGADLVVRAREGEK